MGSVVDITTHWLRAAGRRFGLEEAEKADEVMRQACALGRLNEEFVDEVGRAVDHDIRKTVESLAMRVPAEKRAVFEKAARRAYRKFAKEHAAP